MRGILVLSLFCLFVTMMSCSAPSSEGFAPSELPIEEPVAENPPDNTTGNPPAAADWEQQISLSEATLVNGWTLVLNTNETLSHQNLPNGWTVEAIYE